MDIKEYQYLKKQQQHFKELEEDCKYKLRGINFLIDNTQRMLDSLDNDIKKNLIGEAFYSKCKADYYLIRGYLVKMKQLVKNDIEEYNQRYLIATEELNNYGKISQ